jgi:hypothetical protein
MVEVIDGAFCNPMHVVDASLQEAATADGSIDEGQSPVLACLP